MDEWRGVSVGVIGRGDSGGGGGGPVELGPQRRMGTGMVLQTGKGAARYAEDSGADPATLREQVTSSGGTTEAALRELEDAGVRAAFARAVGAAHERAKELGG